MTAYAGQIASPSDYNDDTRKLVAYGERTSASSTTTTEVGVVRIDGIDVKAGRAYRIGTTSLALSSSVSGDTVRAIIRHTTDGSTATTSSSGMTQTQQVMDSTTQSNNADISFLYRPAADQELSLLLTVARVTGTGNASIFADGGASRLQLVVEDDGPDTGNIGISV